MNNREFTSRVSSQLRMLSKDSYISDRLIISTGINIATKFITQKIQNRSLNRNANILSELNCIEFKEENIFKCGYVEFKSCKALSKSEKSLEDLGLIFTRYGSSIKELYSIDRDSSVFTESTLYQLRLDSNRAGHQKTPNKFYILDNHIYIPRSIKTLSGIGITTDLYETNEFNGCDKEDCKSYWDYDFVCPDSILEDVINYTVQQLSITKQIPKQETSNLNQNT